jgi:hypothetical protein
MGKLDHNLDAYRLAASALERLRALIRRHLEAAHGSEWQAAGIPDDPGEFLAQRRNRESSVKWNPSSATDLLDFAGFVNLHEILTTHHRLRDAFSRLVPEPQTLRLRFLELDTVLNRIAYARPVSESDMELLLGFDERLRQLASDLNAEATGTEQPAREAAPAAVKAEPKPPARPLERAAAQAATPLPPPPPPPPIPRSAQPAGAHTARHREEVGEASAQPAQPLSGSVRAATGKPAVGAAAKAPPEPPVVSNDLEAALKRGEDAVVLSALYQEITALAEKLWGDSASVQAPTWDLVCESLWFRERFSALRLRVVSDFYDLLRAVNERRANGSTRMELQEFLKDRNFAQILMDLREFFRPLLAQGRPG